MVISDTNVKFLGLVEILANFIISSGIMIHNIDFANNSHPTTDIATWY
jgi:hypothetical protein